MHTYHHTFSLTSMHTFIITNCQCFHITPKPSNPYHGPSTIYPIYYILYTISTISIYLYPIIISYIHMFSYIGYYELSIIYCYHFNKPLNKHNTLYRVILVMSDCPIVDGIQYLLALSQIYPFRVSGSRDGQSRS